MRGRFLIKGIKRGVQVAIVSYYNRVYQLFLRNFRKLTGMDETFITI